MNYVKIVCMCVSCDLYGVAYLLKLFHLSKFSAKLSRSALAAGGPANCSQNLTLRQKITYILYIVNIQVIDIISHKEMVK